MPLLFSYGTLQEERVQLSTFGRLLDGERDDLVGFEEASVRIDDPQEIATAGATHHKNVKFTGRNEDRVSGTAFDVTDSELAAADVYEAKAHYRRIVVTLSSGKRSWVYVHAGTSPTER